MLAVSIERDDDVGTGLERTRESVPESRSFAAVLLVDDDVHRQSVEHGGSSIGGAIVYDDHALALPKRPLHDVANRARFVVGGNDDYASHQYIAPLTDKTCPEIYPASSDTRKATACATSST